ncbi:MAG: SGNH/GDSL hydrolase family protein [Candidatus Marinimicrobia bacterium]|nr:SGNH/GDSL hydrolase family protein [Candidatus Neomarinimicrobiota bacterium]
MKTFFRQDEKLLFIGDSITDAGRTNHMPPYGEGYVAFFRLLMMARHPELDLNYINEGIAANTLEGLSLRWERDVIMVNPDRLFIMIGINDSVQHLSSRKDPGVLYKSFRETLTNLILRAKENGIFPIYLLSPFYIHADNSTPLWKVTCEYADIIKDIAQSNDIVFLDFHHYFREHTCLRAPGYWSNDGIHPLPHAHLLIAEKIYRELYDE